MDMYHQTYIRNHAINWSNTIRLKHVQTHKTNTVLLYVLRFSLIFTFFLVHLSQPEPPQPVLPGMMVAQVSRFPVNMLFETILGQQVHVQNTNVSKECPRDVGVNVCRLNLWCSVLYDRDTI